MTMSNGDEEKRSEESESESEQVPVIDLSFEERDEARVVEEIAAACSRVGFFQVTSHGVPTELIEEYRARCRAFFASPKEEKDRWRRDAGNARGFFDDELTKRRRDWKECLDVGVPGSRDWSVPDDDPSNDCLDGRNRLPSRDGLRDVVAAYFDACAALAHRLAVLMAAGLGRPPNDDLLRRLREGHSSYLRCNHYPVCDPTDAAVLAEYDDGAGAPLGISPHRDAGFLTVLLQDDDCHSLQVLSRRRPPPQQRWITVRPVPGAFTVNTGDMAQIWSNDAYVAPLHRVLSNETKERFSAPFFYNPSYDTVVRPLVTTKTTSAGDNDDSYDVDEAVYRPVSWGYYRAVRFAGDLTDLGVEIQTEDFRRDAPSDHHARRQTMFLEEVDFRKSFDVEVFERGLHRAENGVESQLT